MNDRGIAMVAVLTLMMILVPMGLVLALQARMDLFLQRNLFAELEAFSAAEAGVAHGFADILPGVSFSALLVGPDGRPGTADDGSFPFRGGPPAPFPAPPIRYAVSVEENGAAAVDLISTGFGRDRAKKVIRVTVRRSAFPATPGAFYAPGDVRGLDLGDSGFELSGYDHDFRDSPGHAAGGRSSVPGLAASDPQAADAVRQRLSAEAAARIEGTGGRPSIGVTREFDLAEVVRACRERPERVALPGDVGQSDAILGTRTTPMLATITGDFDVVGTVRGAGLLVVDGLFHVSGVFDYAGVVVALGGIVFEPSSAVTIRGAVWRVPNGDPRLRLAGRGGVAYSSGALGEIEQTLAGVLPHAPEISGWREVL